ncbi:MAG: enoyl-CoA hydratase [Rhodospirillaceae bacterium]|nr:enoyl-CoA hydratase [Rhodospirillaceae bacterium]|tara:strand:+ start:580 stop:1365 length:786 start_codon:yes stop_codon:yes gene_type:complete
MPDISNLETVDVSISEHIAVVTMNNPPVNAQNKQFHEELTLVFDVLSDREDVRAVVLTGAGKCFSAGADIKDRANRKSELGGHWSHSRRVRECFHSIMECNKPVIAAINGPALGAGLAVAASADILLASDNASIGLPEINVGLLGGARHAMRLFGHSKTRRLMLTGQRLSGADLYRLGVVEDCVAPEKLMEVTLQLATELASKSPLAMTLAKGTLNAIEEMTLRDGYRYEQNKTVELSATEDSQEAITAFAEKRRPVFKGR